MNVLLGLLVSLAALSAMALVVAAHALVSARRTKRESVRALHVLYEAQQAREGRGWLGDGPPPAPPAEVPWTPEDELEWLARMDEYGVDTAGASLGQASGGAVDLAAGLPAGWERRYDEPWDERAHAVRVDGAWEGRPPAPGQMPARCGVQFGPPGTARRWRGEATDFEAERARAATLPLCGGCARGLARDRVWDPPYIVECPACGARSGLGENSLIHRPPAGLCQSSQLRIVDDEDSGYTAEELAAARAATRTSPPSRATTGGVRDDG